MVSPSILDQVNTINFDIEVRHFRDYLLGLCAEQGIRTDVGICAISEVIGIAAATLDAKEGTNLLADRLHQVCERATTMYERRRNNPNPVVQP